MQWIGACLLMVMQWIGAYLLMVMQWISACLLMMVSGSVIDVAYELRLDPEHPLIGTMRLNFGEPVRVATPLTTRELNTSGLIDQPVCENTGDKLQLDGAAWIVPPGCSSVSWSVSFDMITGPDVNLSQQRRLYHPDGWWLFTEWDMLLRPDPAPSRSRVCADVRGVKSCRQVPGRDSPPLFLAAGSPRTRMDMDGTSFRFYVGSLPQDFDVAHLHDRYRTQLSYLRALAGKDAPTEIDVVLLGIDAAFGAVGGAAGSSAYLANIVVEDGVVSAEEQIRSLWLSGHELTHLLGMDTGPLWVSESLAHYYGFKSLGEDVAATQLFEDMARDAPRMGLLEAYKRVTKLGEGQYYGLFYSRGAAFWRALDSLIAEETDGVRDLDDFLHVLRDEPFGADGALAKKFIETVSGIVGEQALKRLMRMYL